MKMTGELLKAERLKQELKISDIAFVLKIAPRVIQNIEDGEMSSLPAKTFVRGFVKSYAEYLKLDSTAVLKQFQEEMGSTSPVPKSPPPSANTKSSDEETKKTNITPPRINDSMHTGLTRNHILVFATVSLLIMVLVFVNHIINKYSKQKMAAVEITMPKYQVIDSAALSADQQITDMQTMSQTIPASTDASSTTEKVNTEPESDKNTIAEKTDKNLTINYPPLGTSLGKPVEVLIEAKKDITIEYAKGSATVFEKIIIKENSYQIIRSQTGLHLRSGDSSQFILTVNGVVQTGTKTKPFQISF